MGHTPQVTYISQSKTSGSLILSGCFEVDEWFVLREILLKMLQDLPSSLKTITLDFKTVTSMDTFGSWRLASFIKSLEQRKTIVSLDSCSSDCLEIIQELKEFKVPSHVSQALKPVSVNPITLLGSKVQKSWLQFVSLVTFLGRVLQSFWSCIWDPQKFRYKSFIKFLDYTGVRALPIIGLVALLIGVVLVYQGVSQLEKFGAEIFTVNLLAVSVLRELGILMTAIVVAGRSGSAFTAQIGFMKLNQEIDAMKVLGLDPYQLLVIPRILALMVVLPLLTVFCDLVALAGGAYMSMEIIGLSLDQFLNQLQLAITPATFWVGIAKAPVFAFFIGLIGCYEGLRVNGGAEDVGRRTTKSVVKSIFMVIVLNAIFSVVFSILKI